MIEVRGLDPDDADAAWRQNRAAFNIPPGREAPFRRLVERGIYLGAFDAGRLVGVCGLRPYEQWYAGRAVPMTGLGGVTVAPHARGRGVAKAMLTAALGRMREQGAAVSALYPSNPIVYRSAGWEYGGSLNSVTLPTRALDGARGSSALVEKDAGEPVTLRPAEAADLDAVHALYTGAVRDAVGPLTRTGPLFGPATVQELTGVLLAEREGAAAGYVSFDRGGGDPPLDVFDLVGSDPAVLAALLRSVGSWQTVTEKVWIRVADPALFLLVSPTRTALSWQETWMARLVDAPAAVARRGWRAGAEATVDVDLVDPDAPWQSGRWRLEVGDGSGTLERGGSGAVRVHVRGLSALFTGFASTPALRSAGLLDGEPADAEGLDAAFAGRPPWMVDYF